MDTTGASREKEVMGCLEIRSRIETKPSVRPMARKREAGEMEMQRMGDGGCSDLGRDISPAIERKLSG